MSVTFSDSYAFDTKVLNDPSWLPQALLDSVITASRVRSDNGFQGNFSIISISDDDDFSLSRLPLAADRLMAFTPGSLRPSPAPVAIAATTGINLAPPNLQRTGVITAAAISELFFSEYIEGSSNNKALEIYNGTGAAIDLGAGGYVIQMYFNGNTTAGTTINLTGTVAAGDVFVLAQASANDTIKAQADQTNSSSWYNGDDAVVLLKNGTIIDVIGQIGVDPGSEWGSGLVSTQDNTLRRNSTVTAGDTDASNAFDPSLQWEGFAQDTFDGLGSHTVTGGSTPGITLTQSSGSTSVVEGGTSDTYTLVLNTQPTGDVTIAITTDSQIDTDVTLLTFTTSNWNQAQTVTVTAVDDATNEGNHSGTITHAVSSSDANYNGLALSPVTVSITDNDLTLTPIYQIQGSGTASPFADGTQVLTTGVVVGDFQGNSKLNGFFIQDLTGDGNAATSDGIFVYVPAANPFFGTDVQVGDLVQITASVKEFNTMTELDAPEFGLVQTFGSVLIGFAVLNLIGYLLWRKRDRS